MVCNFMQENRYMLFPFNRNDTGFLHVYGIMDLYIIFYKSSFCT